MDEHPSWSCQMFGVAMLGGNGEVEALLEATRRSLEDIWCLGIGRGSKFARQGTTGCSQLFQNP